MLAEELELYEISVRDPGKVVQHKAEVLCKGKTFSVDLAISE